MPICTVHLLHSPYMRHLTVKSGKGAHCIFCSRAYNTLSPPLFIRLGNRKRRIGSEKGVGIEKFEKYLFRS